MGQYIDAVCREWKIVCGQRNLCEGAVRTVFCGGGTPSVLSVSQWRRLVDGLFSCLNLEPGAEWTIECNPESFTREKARVWRDAGVNRLSIGVQTLDDRLLRLLGRPHTAAQALALLNDPAVERFDSIGVDLIYGLPGQTEAMVRKDCAALLSIPLVKHLSAYELTLGEATPFGRHKGMLPLPDEERAAAMAELVRQEAAAFGFEHYEVSNFARPGHRCRHNLAYWRHEPYLGLGPAAHSFVSSHRFANVQSLEEYLRQVQTGCAPVAFEERLDTTALGEELLMLGLRTSDGVDAVRFKQLTGTPLDGNGRGGLLVRFEREGFLVREGNRWRPTVRGMAFADGLARELASCSS
jgi:oxygen-independent coproporphyrinogen-3 oxidase